MFNIQIVTRKSSFRINNIPNLQQWLDASQLVGLSNNDVMTLWPDLSGNSRNITSFTGSPQYKTNIQGGLPGVSLETGQGMTGSYSVTSGAMTIVAVLKSTSTSNSGRRAISGDTNYLIGPYTGTWKAFNNSAFLNSGVVISSTSAVICVMTQDGSGAHIYVNSLSNTDSTAAVNYPGTINFGVVGAFAEAMLGDICESAIFDRTLSLDEIQSIFLGLSQKWSIN